LAALADLADWVGEEIVPGTPDGRRAEAALRQASTLVRAETGSDWVDGEGRLLARIPDAVIEVTCSAAGRHHMNPEGLTGENIDDYQSYRKVDEVGVHLTAAERQMLAHAVGGSARKTAGLSTVRTYRSARPARAPRWLVNGPDPPDGRDWP
jgi:hypothetical protein